MYSISQKVASKNLNLAFRRIKQREVQKYFQEIFLNMRVTNAPWEFGSMRNELSETIKVQAMIRDNNGQGAGFCKLATTL